MITKQHARNVGVCNKKQQEMKIENGQKRM